MKCLRSIGLFLSLGFGLPCFGEEAGAKPVELEVVKGAIGVWDGEVEVWAAGPDSEPMTMTTVETNRAFGEYWISSDLDTKVNGQTMTVHAIVGYDLEKGKLVGTVVDHGPYAASMTGEYDAATKTVHWTTRAKTPDGREMVQKTTVTQKSADERVLVLSMKAGAGEGFVKFMRIRYLKRK
ncbi:MAG: DUF1579 family protein [Verrucomicrobiaceae bacterium]